LPIREIFLSQWNELIKLTKDVADRTSTWRITISDFLTKQKDIKSQVYNSLKQFTYEFYKKELGGSQYITGEAKEKVVGELATYLAQLKGDPLVYNPLILMIQNIRTAHSKEVEFRNKACKVFRRELLLSNYL
jgi:hypothetical protein